MKKALLVVLSTAIFISSNSQVSIVYQKGIALEQNLNVIGSLAPYASGGLGFDNRYEGVKGSPRLSDSLLPSLLRIRGQDQYFQLRSDIDLVQNALIYRHPQTGKIYMIPSGIVEELIINKDGKDLIFRTTTGKVFDKEIKEERFIQILSDGPYQFVKMPVKVFIEADYKNAYSSDRRYDEFQNKDRYYLSGPDNVFYQIQLTRKSVLKILPGKKKIIDQEPDEKSFADKEEMIISLLEKL